MKKVDERVEILWRILVAIVSGIILSIWKVLITIIALVNLVYVLINGKREKKLADFCEHYNTELYRFVRYLTFETNKRPFPFSEMGKFGKFEK